MDLKYHLSLFDKDSFEKYILKKQCFDNLVLLYKHDKDIYFMGEMEYEEDLKYCLAKIWSEIDKNNKAYYWSNFILHTNIISDNIADAIDRTKGETTGNIYIYEELYMDNVYLKKNFNARSAMILSDFLTMIDFGCSYPKEMYYNDVKYIKIVNHKYFHPQILIDKLSNGFIFALFL